MSTELLGAWRLRSFRDLAEDGTLSEGPLGPDPRGLLVYTGDGHVSVTMMRGDAPATNYMSYAGTWRRQGAAGEVMVHAIQIAPNPDWVGTEQLRDLTLSGDLLTLTGNALREQRRRVLEWQRAR